MSEERNWLISVDDHVIEPADVWQSRIPAKLRDGAPKLVQDDEGWAWTYEGKRQPMTGLAAVAGTPKETWNPAPIDFGAMLPAYNDPKERTKVMDEDGVLASLAFPSYPRFCGQTFLESDDKELARLCVEAYNDWMIDEWCASAPGRFIPLIITPLWDPVLAAAEVRRCADKGAKSVAWSENPSKLGLPSIHDAGRHWDPLFDACAETGLPLSIHIGSSSAMIQTSPDAPLCVGLALIQLNSMQAFADWLYSGNLLRYPDLKVCLSEGGVSWMPYLLEMVSFINDREAWAKTVKFEGNVLTGDMRQSGSAFGDVPDFDPLEVFRRNLFGCQIPDTYGWEALEYLGYDNVMLETDYPHTASSYPNSAEEAAQALKHLPEEARQKVLVGNACRVYNFTPADMAPLGPSQ